MSKKQSTSAADYHTSNKPTWCPGCGNYTISFGLMQVLAHLGYQPHQVALTFDIGCSGNGADKVKTYSFKSLHGRALLPAIGIKYANHSLPVITMIGDGGMYWEGAAHWIAAAQRNEDITVFVADNQIYGLTTGQTSPTTTLGCQTKTQPEGTLDQPINPIAVSLAAGATFVARAWVGNPVQMQQIMKKAIRHKGFAIVDILQTCVTFNRVNTLEYYRERVYQLEDESHDATDKGLAYKKAEEKDETPLGIFYQVRQPTIYGKHQALQSNQALINQKTNTDIAPLLKLFH